MKVSGIVLFSSVILLPVLYCDVPNNEEENLEEEAPSKIIGSGRKHISTSHTEDLDEINLSRESAKNEETKSQQFEPDGVNTELEEQKNNTSIDNDPFPPPNAPLTNGNDNESFHEAHEGINEKLPEITSFSSADNNSNQKGNIIDTPSGHNDKSEIEMHDQNDKFSNSKNDEKENRDIVSQTELQNDGEKNLSREISTNTKAEKNENAEVSLSQVESKHPLETHDNGIGIESDGQSTPAKSKPEDKITKNKSEESPQSSKINDENSDLPNSSTKNGIENLNNVRKKLEHIFTKFKRKKPKLNQAQGGQKGNAKINNSSNEGINANLENETFSEVPQKSDSVSRENLVNAESSKKSPTNKIQPPQEDEINEESPTVSEIDDGDHTQRANDTEKGDAKINNSSEINASPENDTFRKLSQKSDSVNGENFNNTNNESSETLSMNKSQPPQEDEVNEESPIVSRNEDGNDTPSTENAEKGDGKINISGEINTSPENDMFNKFSQESDRENFNNTNIMKKIQPPQEDQVKEESPVVSTNEDGDDTVSADNAEKGNTKINISGEINASPENDTFSKHSQESDNVNGENFNNTNIMNKIQPPQEDSVNEESPIVSKNEDGDDILNADNAKKRKSSSEEINASPENNKFSELSQKSDNVNGENFNNTNIESSETLPMNKSQLPQENEINEASPKVRESENGDNNSHTDNLDKGDTTVNDLSNEEINSNPENNTFSKLPLMSKNVGENNLSNTNIRSSQTSPKNKSQPVGEDKITEESPIVGENDDIDNLSTNYATPRENSQNRDTDILSKNLSNKNETNDNESWDIMSKEQEDIAGEDDSKNTSTEDILEENSSIQTRSSLGENEDKNNSTLNQFDNLEEMEDETDEDPTDDEIETENNDGENLSNNFTPGARIYEELQPKIDADTNSEIQSGKNGDDEIESEEGFPVFDDVYETNDDDDSQEADEMPQGNEETKFEKVNEENEDNHLEPLHASRENDSQYLDKGNNDPSQINASQEVDKKIKTDEIEPANSDSKVEHLNDDSSLVGSVKGEEDEDGVPEETPSEKDTKISNRDLGEEQPLQIENEFHEVLQNGTRNIKPEHENNNSLPLDKIGSKPTEKYDNDQDENPTVILPEVDESRENGTEDINASSNTPTPRTTEEEKPKVTVWKTSNNTESGTTLGTSKTDNEMKSEDISEQVASSESSETNSSNKQNNNSIEQLKESPFVYKSIFVSYFSPALQRLLTNRMQMTAAQRPPANNNEALPETVNGTPPPKPSDSELNVQMNNSTQNDSMSFSNENDSAELGTWNKALLKEDDDDYNDDDFSQEEGKYLPSESNKNTERDPIVEHITTTSLPSVIQSRSNSSLKEGDLSDPDTNAVPEEKNEANLPIDEVNYNSAEISNTNDADPLTIEELPQNFTKNKSKRNPKPQRDSSNRDTLETPEETNKNNLSLDKMIDDPVESSETVDEDSPLIEESPKNIPENRPKIKENKLPSNPQTKSLLNANHPPKKRPGQFPLKNKYHRPQPPSGSNSAPSANDLVPQNTSSMGPSNENKPPEESEKSEELGQPTLEMEENDSQATDDNYPEEIIENELLEENDKPPPEIRKMVQSDEPNFIRPNISPSTPPQRKNNFPQKKKSKISTSKSSNLENEPDLDENHPEESIENELPNELSEEDDKPLSEIQKKAQSDKPKSHFIRPTSISIPPQRKNNFPQKKKSKISTSKSSNSENEPDLDENHPDENIENELPNELSEEDDKPLPEIQKKAQSDKPKSHFIRPTSPSIPPQRKNNFPQKKKSKTPKCKSSNSKNKSLHDNYPEESIENELPNELSEEDDKPSPEIQKKAQSNEPKSHVIRPVSPSIPPQRKNNFQKSKIPKSKNSNFENKPPAREFVSKAKPAIPNKSLEEEEPKEPNLPSSKLTTENPQATNDDSFEDDLPEDDFPENVSSQNGNTSKDSQKNATNTFPSDNNVYLREMPQPDTEEMSVETRDNEPENVENHEENTNPKDEETTEDESESETSSTEGGNELPAINSGNNPVKFNPLQGMAMNPVNPFSSYFPPVFSPFMRSFNQPPIARQTNEATESVPPARVSNPPATPPQPSNEEDDITEEEPSSEVESLENRDNENPIIADQDNVEPKPEPANESPPPVYKSMFVSFLSPATSKQQPTVRSSSYFSMGTGDNPFWSAMQRIVGIGVKNAGALIEGAGKVSEAGFDATKDVFDMVKKVPVVRDVISPVKKFAENGLDVADQTVTGSLLSIGSYINDQGQTTRQRSLGQLGPDRYRYRYPYPNSDESNNDLAAEKQQAAPSSLWSFGKFAMNGPTTQNTRERSLNNQMPYYSRYRYSQKWK